MMKYDKSPTHSQKSVKSRAKPLKGPYFAIADFSDDGDVHILSNDNRHAKGNLTSQSSEILSTSELLSAADQILDCASRSLAHFQPKASFDCSGISQKDTDSDYLVGNDRFGLINILGSGYLHVDLISSSSFSCIVQKSLKLTGATWRMCYDPCNGRFIENSFWQIGDDSSLMSDICLKKKSWTDCGTLYKLMNRSGWMSHIPVWQNLPTSLSSNTKKMLEALTSKAAVCHCCPVSESEVSSSNGGIGNLDTCGDTTNLEDLYSCGSNKLIMLWRESVSFLYKDYLLHRVENKNLTARSCKALSLGYHGDDYVTTSAPDCTDEPNQLNVEDDQFLENEMRQYENYNTQDEHQSKSCLSLTNKPHPLLAKREHAVSGALAGIFVSVCLHPIDTIKTILQSCQPGQKSISYIGQSVISERGVLGLYRGIASNITASAPISAIYTFTYESVKGFLLPSLAKEYHSVAHCTAGACASVATSFVFTPSERIKQQMQVNTKYQNCWKAVQRIIETGGLRSLYVGWGAVLCRNIPHSIIKFYTYESLKQMLMSSQPPNKQPNMLQTLFCGGLAGSTAALFSTPFDVVKTRLQTQMPGSLLRYDGISCVFQDIRKNEGVRGLFRGLIPRLAMCMSQGALFFASYECFKNLLSLELRQHKPEVLQHEQGSNDDSLFSL